LALASDAFVQQSVNYPIRTANSTAIIPISQHYDRHGDVVSHSSDIDHSMKAAIYDGAFVANLSQTSASLSPRCRTGNCTFPTYASLSVCSYCRDVSGLVGINSTDADGCVQLVLPNGLFLQDCPRKACYLALSAEHGLNTDELDAYQPSLVDVSMLLYDEYDVKNSRPDTVLRPFAYDCIFSVCVQTYNAEVSYGQSAERASETSYVDLVFDGTTRKATIPQSHLPHHSNLIFSISEKGYRGFVGFMSQVMDGTGGVPGDGTLQWSNDIVQAIYLNGAAQVPRTMANIAEAMTNTMRLNSGQLAMGTAMLLESYIHVR
jgi:hypothetical protein